MFIKEITVEDAAGLDVAIIHKDGGVIVRHMNRGSGKSGTVIAEFQRRDSEEKQFAQAKAVANVIYGPDSYVNSMIHDIWREMQRVAGC